MQIAAMCLFIVLEFFFKKEPIRFFKKGFWIDIVWFTYIQGILLQYLVFQFIDSYLSQFQLHLVTDLPVYGQLVISILLIEFVAYWSHRLNHSWWIMWRIHEVHHSSLELNWLSANRIHFLETMVVRLLSGGIIAILGASETTLYIFMIFDSFMALFIHSNLSVRIGPLKYLFNSPEMHHVHHSNKLEYQNTNFGDKLALWDWIFGTALVLNANQMKDIKFGIGYEYPQDFAGLNFHMFRKKDKEMPT